MKILRIFSSNNYKINLTNNNKNQQNHCHYRYREKKNPKVVVSFCIASRLSSSVLLLLLRSTLLLISCPETTTSFQIWPIFSSFPKLNSKNIQESKESQQQKQQQKDTKTITKTIPGLHPIVLQELQVDKFLIRERNSFLELNKNTDHKMKAWTCHGGNQKDLVDRLIQAGIIKSYPVQQVMYQVDRKNYIISNGNNNYNDQLQQQQNQNSNNQQVGIQQQSSSFISASSAYQDTPQPIYNGQTISAPHMHAHALEEIYPYIIRRRNYILDTTNTTKEQNCINILDVGCGSGYLTACFGRWFQPKQNTINVDGMNNNNNKNDTINYNYYNKSILTSELPTTSTSTATSNIHGYVYGIDIHESLVSLTQSNIQKEDSDLLVQQIPTSTTISTTNNIQPTIQLQVSNGWDGLIEYGPYDAIHVGAAASTFPIQLANQLSIGGVMIIPIGQQGSSQSLYKVERISTNAANTQSSSSNSDNNKFNPNHFKYTELLGVRYVPLINGPTTTNSVEELSSSSTPSPPWNNNNNNNGLKP